MADLASLRIAVDSRPVDQASNDLDELAASARRAEGATDGLTGSTRTTSAAMAGMSNAVRQAKAAQNAAAAAMAGTGGAAKLTASQMTNLSYQVQDLGVQLASGAPPMMAFIQQGSQIAGIMQQSQMGVLGFTKAVISSTAAVVASMAMNPIFATIATSIGLVTAAVNFMADDITKASKVTVTASDVMLGAFDVLRDFISNKVAAAFNYFGIDAGKAWDAVIEYTRKGVNIAIGLITLLPRVFIESFKVIPQAIAKLFAGDFAGAMQIAVSSASNIVKGTFQRDFIGDIGSVLQGAAVNRAVQRQAREVGKTIGRSVGKAAVKQAAEEAETSNDMVYRMFGNLKAELPEASTEAILDDIKKVNDGAKELQDTWDIINKQQLEETNKRLNEMLSLIFGIAPGLQNAFQGLGDALSKAFGKAEIDRALQPLKDAFQDIAKTFGDDFSKALGAAGAGAQVGTATSGIMSVVGIKNSKAGAQIGGAIGGAAFGPLGAIGGSIIGGLVGGLFKKTKSASATIEAIGGNAAIASINGNSAKMKTAAQGMANSLLDGLMGIADQFNATLGNFKISIGQRDKTFRVDVTGQGRTKNMPSFETEEEAVRYAMQQAIQMGAIAGLRAGTETLLKAQGDLEVQMEKALAFESVFNRLEEASDPLKYNLGLLEKEFNNLRDVFEEASASAEDFAALEKLYSIEREKIFNDAQKEAQDILRDAYNNEASILKETADNFRNIGQALRELAGDMQSFIAGGESVSNDLERQFFETARLARLGDVQAMEALPSLGRDLADLIRENAPDRLSMIRQLSAIQNEATAAADVAGRRASIADQQLSALNEQVSQLIAIEDEVITVAQAINRLTSVMATATGVPVPAATSTATNAVYDSNQAAAFNSNANTSQQVSALRDEMKVSLFQIAKNTGQTAIQLSRWDGDGMPDARGF